MPITTENTSSSNNTFQLDARNTDIQQELKKQQAVQKFDEAKANTAEQKGVELKKRSTIETNDAVVKGTDFKEAASLRLEEGKEQVPHAAGAAAELKDAALQKAIVLKDAAVEKAIEYKDGALEKGAELKEVAKEKSAQLMDSMKGWKDTALEKGHQMQEAAAVYKDTAVEKSAELKDAALEKGAQLQEKISGFTESALAQGAEIKRDADRNVVNSTSADAKKYDSKFPFTGTAATHGGPLRESALEFDNAALIKNGTIAHAASPTERSTTAPAYSAESSTEGFASQAMHQIKDIAGTVAHGATDAAYFVEQKIEHSDMLHNVVEKVSDALHTVKEAVFGHEKKGGVADNFVDKKVSAPLSPSEQILRNTTGSHIVSSFEKVSEAPLDGL